MYTRKPPRPAISLRKARAALSSRPTETTMQAMTLPHQPDPTCQREDVAPPYVPMLLLNQEGLIECLTTAAHRLLEYRPGQRVKLPFLSHVHQQNLYRAMRDLEEIILHGRRKASWMLRLYTGRNRWRWYEAVAERRLQRSGEIAVAVRLKAL